MAAQVAAIAAVAAVLHQSTSRPRPQSESSIGAPRAGATVPATTERTDHEFARDLEARYTAEHPWGKGWRWKAQTFSPGWVKIWPVYSRWRNLYRRLRGWVPEFPLGGVEYVRCSDGLVLSFPTTPHEFEPCVFAGVFRDIGETAAANEIQAEINRRSLAWWAERGFAPSLVFDESVLEEALNASEGSERAAIMARAKAHWVERGIPLPADTEAQWAETFDDFDALDDLLRNPPEPTEADAAAEADA